MKYNGVFIPATIATSQEFTASEKMACGVVLGLIVNGGRCYASNAWIAREVGISSRSVSRAITKLFELGYIKEKRAHRKDHKRVLVLRNGGVLS